MAIGLKQKAPFRINSTRTQGPAFPSLQHLPAAQRLEFPLSGCAWPHLWFQVTLQLAGFPSLDGHDSELCVSNRVTATSESCTVITKSTPGSHKRWGGQCWLVPCCTDNKARSCEQCLASWPAMLTLAIANWTLNEPYSTLAPRRWYLIQAFGQGVPQLSGRVRKISFTKSPPFLQRRSANLETGWEAFKIRTHQFSVGRNN